MQHCQTKHGNNAVTYHSLFSNDGKLIAATTYSGSNLNSKIAVSITFYCNIKHMKQVRTSKSDKCVNSEVKSVPFVKTSDTQVENMFTEVSGRQKGGT